MIKLSKTEEVIKLLESGENDTAKIKEQTGASESLITRCRNKLEKQKYKKEEIDDEPSDEEIDECIKKIKITPDEKYLTNNNNNINKDNYEEYKCMGCNHEWKSKSVPKRCPNCGAEF